LAVTYFACAFYTSILAFKKHLYFWISTSSAWHKIWKVYLAKVKCSSSRHLSCPDPPVRGNSLFVYLIPVLYRTCVFLTNVSILHTLVGFCFFVFHYIYLTKPSILVYITALLFQTPEMIQH
jgi:hypothetical protein